MKRSKRGQGQTVRRGVWEDWLKRYGGVWANRVLGGRRVRKH